MVYNEDMHNKPWHEALTVVEAAKKIGVAHTTIYAAIKKKELKFARKHTYGHLSSTIMIHQDALTAWNEKRIAEGRDKLGRPKKGPQADANNT